MREIVCKACGAALPADARHCGGCGFRLAPMIPRSLTDSERQGLGEEEFLAHADTLVGIKPPPVEPPQRAPRRHRRFALRVAISYGSEHNFYTGATENISSGGLFVATNEPLAIAQRVEARFTLPGIEQPFSVPCVVRWVRAVGAGGPGVPGMGLAFESLDHKTEQSIDSFLVHREPVLHED